MIKWNRKGITLSLCALVLLVCIIIVACTSSSSDFSFQYDRENLIFENWQTNVANLSLDTISIQQGGGVSSVTFFLDNGDRFKFAQIYHTISPSFPSFDNYTLFSFDFLGSGTLGDLEVKFETNTEVVSYVLSNFSGVSRWIRGFSLSTSQFPSFSWDKLKVISFALITSSPSFVSGTYSLANISVSQMNTWDHPKKLDFINPKKYSSIASESLQAIVNRQTEIGLLTTWMEDNSSWLYGQGLCLKLLSLVGEWTNEGVPLNQYAISAQRLAHFLADNIQPEGFWPRSFDSVSGEIINFLESDGTIWMGDFPWAIVGLQTYSQKSGDSYIKMALDSSLLLLRSLVFDDLLHTQNILTGTTRLETSCEAGAVTSLALGKEGQPFFDRLLQMCWNPNLELFHETSSGPSRLVLFSNTWLVPLDSTASTKKKAAALASIGKVLYTCGPGEPCGMDGIGPLAVWFEGTLSYISAGGPGSSLLFESLLGFRNDDGTIDHYNDNLGSVGGIWAVPWSSLDATVWLAFASLGINPFNSE